MRSRAIGSSFHTTGGASKAALLEQKRNARAHEARKLRVQAERGTKRNESKAGK